MSHKSKIVALFAVLAALALLPGCSTLKPYLDTAVSNVKDVISSVEFEVTEEGASVDGVGVSGSVNWKTIGCTVVGFVGLDLCAPE